MKHAVSASSGPLHILYIEDNPLIVFHVEQMIEDLGHVFVGSLASFEALKAEYDGMTFDGALIDIDLTDGRTGPLAAEWLHHRGIPSMFLTGQADVASGYGHVSLGTLSKPVDMDKLAEALELFRRKPGPDPHG
ncbi:response regulator [Jiella pacifica]|uniref:Response regulator n=1 Tax=Jiella pacifica TaxID=2696469 RepID=A0A6N9T5Z1_9HYPH|nr:response regulator [Jiella pacifica]MAU95491.1 response regulator [Fulvimarina sp.]NDW06804.1 response regulator [Jiella pacifica]